MAEERQYYAPNEKDGWAPTLVWVFYRVLNGNCKIVSDSLNKNSRL